MIIDPNEKKSTVNSQFQPELANDPNDITPNLGSNNFPVPNPNPHQSSLLNSFIKATDIELESSGENTSPQSKFRPRLSVLPNITQKNTEFSRPKRMTAVELNPQRPSLPNSGQPRRWIPSGDTIYTYPSSNSPLISGLIQKWIIWSSQFGSGCRGSDYRAQYFRWYESNLLHWTFAWCQCTWVLSPQFPPMNYDQSSTQKTPLQPPNRRGWCNRIKQQDISGYFFFRQWSAW